MSVSTVPSTKQTSYSRRRKTVSHKRRQNQNAEISELASLLPLSTPSLPPPSVSGDHAGPLVPSNGQNSLAMDKLSVLRLASTYLKLQQFMKGMTSVNGSCAESIKHPFGAIEEAMDGFLIVLDKEGNILYVSETIIDCVGLRQQDAIGQSLVDITHPASAVEITDSLKPSVTFPSSVAQPDGVFSQFRQFYVRFKSTVYNSRITSHTMVQVNGNLKVKLLPSKIANSGDSELEFVEPSVIGFIGECRRIDTGCSALDHDVLLPLTSFSWTKTLDKRIIYIDASIKDIIGYDPDDIFAKKDGDELGPNLLHPADSNIIAPMRKYFVQNGHVVSPLIRVLTSSGDWIWMTAEVTLRYKSGTNIPQFVEFKARVLSQGMGKVKYAVQRKPYISTSNPSLDKDELMDCDSMPKSTTSKNGKEMTTKQSVDSLKGIKLPDAIFKAVLRTRMREHAKLAALNVTNNADCELTSQNDQAMIQRRNVDIVGTDSQPFCAATANDPDVAQTSSAHTDHTTMSCNSSSALAQAQYNDLECSSCTPESHFTGEQPKQVLLQIDSQTDLPVDSSPSIQCQNNTISCGAHSGMSPPFNSTPSIHRRFSPSSCSSSYVDTISHTTAVSTDSIPPASVLEPFQNNHQTSNISSQGYCNLGTTTDLYFPSCTFPCGAHSNPEYVPNQEELMPGTQNLMPNDLNNPSDPLMQQVLGDTDIIDGNFNLNGMALDLNWSKSEESTDFSSHANIAACTTIPAGFRDHYLWCLPQKSHTTADQSNHEIHDILQQFM